MSKRFTVESVFKAVDLISAPVSRMQQRMQRMTRSMTKGLRTINQALGKVTRGFRRAGSAALKLAAVGIAGVTAGVVLLLRQFSKVEDAEAAFTPMLRGAEKAKKLVEALNKTAATTPFQFGTLADTAKQLLPVIKGGIEPVIKTIRMLGDTAGGNAQKLESITRGFTKAMLKGKVDMESLNMIGEAGVPIFEDLAAVMGVKVNAQFFKMISAGKVTTMALTKAFKRMTSEGGLFFNGMEIASKTLSGKFSTLQDNISLTAAGLGEVLAPTVKDLIEGATGVAKGLREWVTINKELIRDKFVTFVKKVKVGMMDFIETIRTLNKEQSVFEKVLKGIDAVVTAITFLVNHGKTILKVVAIVWSLSFAFSALSGALGLVNFALNLTPLGRLLTIATLLGGAIAAMVLSSDDLSKSFPIMTRIIEGAKITINELGTSIDSIFSRIIKSISSIMRSGKSQIDTIISDIMGAVDSVSKVVSTVGNALGFGGEDTQKGLVAPQLISPQARQAREISETVTKSTSELTIKDETGRAQITKAAKGSGLKLQQTGGF